MSNLNKPNDPILVGKITAPQGLKGEVRVRANISNPMAIDQFGCVWNKSLTKSYNIKALRSAKNNVIVKIENITNRNQSEELVGEELFIDKSNLPEPNDNEFYIDDLINLDVKTDTSNEVIGKIVAVHNFNAGDIIEVRRPNNKSFMVSFREEFVLNVNIEAGIVTIVESSIIEN